eukprot:10219878-Alexandrium_andersonii.AAC.1
MCSSWPPAPQGEGHSRRAPGRDRRICPWPWPTRPRASGEGPGGTTAPGGAFGARHDSQQSRR